MTGSSDTRKLIIVIQVVLWVFMIGNTTYHWGKIDGLSEGLDIMLATRGPSSYSSPPVLEPPLPYPIPDPPQISPDELDALEDPDPVSGDCYFKIGGRYNCQETEDEEKTPGEEWWEYKTQEGELKI